MQWSAQYPDLNPIENLWKRCFHKFSIGFRSGDWRGGHGSLPFLQSKFFFFNRRKSNLRINTITIPWFAPAT